MAIGLTLSYAHGKHIHRSAKLSSDHNSINKQTHMTKPISGSSHQGPHRIAGSNHPCIQKSGPTAAERPTHEWHSPPFPHKPHAVACTLQGRGRGTGPVRPGAPAINSSTLFAKSDHLYDPFTSSTATLTQAGSGIPERMPHDMRGQCCRPGGAAANRFVGSRCHPVCGDGRV